MPDQPASPLRDLLQTAADQIAAAAEGVERIYRDSFVSTAKLYGAYRGTVVEDEDPLLRHRVRVQVPEAGDAPLWAFRVLPADGDALATLGPGTGVWVVFEQGDGSLPVVLGAIAE